MLVVDGDHADRASRGRSAVRRGPCGRRAGARSPGRPRGRRSASRSARCRLRSSTRPLFESRSCVVRAFELVRALSGRRRDAESLAPAGSATAPAGRRGAPAAARRRAQERSSSVSVTSAFPTSFSDSSCARPARRRLVQARVLDRDRGLGGEQRRRAPRPPRRSRPRPPSRSGRGCRRRRRAA